MNTSIHYGNLLKAVSVGDTPWSKSSFDYLLLICYNLSNLTKERNDYYV